MKNSFSLTRLEPVSVVIPPGPPLLTNSDADRVSKSYDFSMCLLHIIIGFKRIFCRHNLV